MEQCHIGDAVKSYFSRCVFGEGCLNMKVPTLGIEKDRQEIQVLSRNFAVQGSRDGAQRVCFQRNVIMFI